MKMEMNVDSPITGQGLSHAMKIYITAKIRQQIY
jgi:hypothetical protein